MDWFSKKDNEIDKELLIRYQHIKIVENQKAWFEAIRKNDLITVEKFLKISPLYNDLICYGSVNGLVRAVDENYFEMANLLLSYKNSEKINPDFAQTALFLAFKNENEQMIDLLIKYGANINGLSHISLTHDYYSNALYLLNTIYLENKSTNIINLLSKYGFDFSNKYNIIYFVDICQQTNFSILVIELLFEKGIPSNFDSYSKGKLILSAINHNNIAVTKYWLNKFQSDFDINKKDEYGDTMLNTILKNMLYHINIEVLEFVLNIDNIDVNIINHSGCNALMIMESFILKEKLWLYSFDNNFISNMEVQYWKPRMIIELLKKYGAVMPLGIKEIEYYEKEK